MSAPYEIIMSPFEVYVAPVGTAFPNPDAAVSSTWKLLGKNGKRNQSEDGVVISHEQTVVKHRTNGSTGPVKIVRSDEDMTIGFTLEDLTIETYSTVMGQTFSEQTQAVGVAGVRSVGLRMGQTVANFAMLVRGPSAYYDGGNAQYEVPVVAQVAGPKPKFSKKDAAGLEVLWTAIEDPMAASDEARFGYLRSMYAPAL
jgi:hypothetical protein